jgi:pyrroline-5-carboxylate reductase
MATALIGALQRSGAAARDFAVVEPVPQQQSKLRAAFPGIAVHAHATAAAMSAAEVVVLAVKPQQMREAAHALASQLASGPVVLSIAAGIRLYDLRRWLGGYDRLVRAMPNTPALIGKGISGIYASASVDAAGRALAAHILEAAGELVWVDEEAMLDAITGVSGSGPAYVFYFMEALEAAARELGFAPPEARKLAYATFSGALALAEASDAEPATLRAQVTSKAGTTERALQTLESDAVKAKIIAAVKAATVRAHELGDALGAQD